MSYFDKPIMVTVNREKWLPISDESTNYKIIEENEIAQKVTSFDLIHDTMFKPYTRSGELISAKERMERIKAAGDVPLDAACASAIWDNKEALRAISMKHFLEKGGLDGPLLQYVDFAGTLLDDGCGRGPWGMHIISLDIDRHNIRNGLTFTVFEICDQGWNEESPCLIFKPEFIQKFISQKAA